MVVAFHDATLATRRTLPLTCAGLPPAGSRQLRGAHPKLSLHVLFNYILKLLYLGCQWKELPIEKDPTGRREIHHIRIWRTFRRWVADGCFNAIFEGTVLTLYQC